MPRFVLVPFLVAVATVVFVPAATLAAPSPAPSAAASEAAANRDAGTIDGVVTEVDYTPGKSKMVVKSGGQTYDFAVLAGTNVQGPTHDFAVDVKVGTRVSVSASKSGTSFTAQIVRVVSSQKAH